MFDPRTLLSSQNNTRSEGTTSNASNQSGRNTGTNNTQSNAWEGINPLFQGWQGYTAQGPQGPNQYQLGAANTAQGIANNGVSTEDINRFRVNNQGYLDALQRNFDAKNGQELSRNNANAAQLGALTGRTNEVSRMLTQKAQHEAQDPITQKALWDAEQNAQQMALGSNQQRMGAAGLEGQIGQQLWNNPQSWWQGQTPMIGAFANASGQNATNTNDFTGATQGWGTNQNQTTQQTMPSWMDTIGRVGQFASMFSDERVKENIAPVGKTFDGQRIYRFNFAGSPQTQIGLLAQDVERRHPDAVGSHSGIKTVDYDAATEHAARKGHYFSGGAVRPGYWGGGATMGGWQTGGGDPFMPQGGAPQQTPQFPQATPGGFNPQMWGQQFAQRFGGNPGFGGWGGGFGYGQPPQQQPRMPAWGQFQTQPAAQPMKPAMANPTAATGGLSPGLATAPQAAAVLGSMGGPGNWSYGASMAPTPAAQPQAAPQNAGATSTTGVLGAPMMAQPMAQPAAATGTGGPSSSLGGWSYGGGNSMQMGGFASGGSVSMADKVGHAFKAFHRMKHEAKNGFEGGGIAGSYPEYSTPEVKEDDPGRFASRGLEKYLLSKNPPLAPPVTGTPAWTPAAQPPAPPGAPAIPAFGATVHPVDFTTDTRPFASGGLDDPKHWDNEVAKAKANPTGSSWPTLGQIGAGLSKLGSPSETTNSTGATSGASSASGQSSQSSDPTGLLGAQASLAKMLAAYSSRPQAAEGGPVRHGYALDGFVTDDNAPPSYLGGLEKEPPPAQPSGGLAGWLGSFLKPTGHYTRDENGVRNAASPLQDLSAFAQIAGGSQSAQGYYDSLRAERDADRLHTRMTTEQMGRTPQGDLTLAAQKEIGKVNDQDTLAKLKQEQEALTAAGLSRVGDKNLPTLLGRHQSEAETTARLPKYEPNTGFDALGRPIPGWVNPRNAPTEAQAPPPSYGGSPAIPGAQPSAMPGAATVPAPRNNNAAYAENRSGEMGSATNPVFVKTQADEEDFKRTNPGGYYTTQWAPTTIKQAPGSAPKPQSSITPGPAPAQQPPPVQTAPAPQQPAAAPPTPSTPGIVRAGSPLGEMDYSKTGTEAFSQLPQVMQIKVAQALDGRIPPPTGMGLRDPHQQAILTAAQLVDPTFDMNAWARRHKMQIDYTPGGKVGTQMKSAEMVVNHLYDLDKAIDKLGNYNAWLGNPARHYIGNPLARKFDPKGFATAENEFNTKRMLTLKELQRFLSGTGGGNLTEFLKLEELLDSSKSTSELQGASRAALDLIGGKLRPYVSAWNQEMKKELPADGLFDKQTRQKLHALEAKLNKGQGAAAPEGMQLPKPIADMTLQELNALPPDKLSDAQFEEGRARRKALMGGTP